MPLRRHISITTLLVPLLVGGAVLSRPSSGQAPSFLTFESGPVRPLALSPDGTRLFAVNTPDARLEIFAVTEAGLSPLTSVPVGLEPVAVAARTNDEVWVVNHLSDSISIVAVQADPPRVVRTLLVGDEPRDLVFAGPGRRRAFVTAAHRGQHRTDPSLEGVPGAGDPRLTTPGIGRADVWVFDAQNLGQAFGGRPLAIVELFGDTPRALATSPDGGTVYAAVFYSGNQTAPISPATVCEGFEPTDLADACPEQFRNLPGGNPGPATNHEGAPAPHVGLVVRYDRAAGEWQDELGRSWDAALRFDLPDLDVFAIDADTLEQISSFAHVGTTLFNMATNPATGTLYVSATEARNEVRFEGPGRFGGSTVQGHLAEARITVISEGEVRPRHLNGHIDYEERPAPPGTKRHSLATPLGMAISTDGATLYVAAFGSSKIGVLPTADLEQGNLDPTSLSSEYIPVSGGGPSGLVLDDARQRLYVATRFDNAVSVIELSTRSEIAHLPFFNPEPPEVVEGRPFLYDADFTSSNGEASCASCHIFGDLDALAWDLGDPDADVTKNPIPIEFGGVVEALEPHINGTGRVDDFHPMKGPMTTQTLRGLVNSGAMHWRGDRATGIFGTDPFDADLSFRNFNVAFEGLVGREEQLSPADMQKFTDFALQIVLPPNPIRRLDNSLTPLQRIGERFYDGPRRADGLPAPSPLGNTCNDCHTLEPRDGHFGTSGEASFENEIQIFKIPHLRNLYQKVGTFGSPETPFFNAGDNGHKGDQVRGTGFLHDGSVDTLFRFFQATVFNESAGGLVGFADDEERRGMEQFMLAFPTDLAPIVGQQITLGSTSAAAVGPRLDLLEQRAAAAYVSEVLGGETVECEVVVKGVVGGEMRGFLYDPGSGSYRSDRRAESPLAAAALRQMASSPGQQLTYTCVPPGSGRRMALDRDLDGHFDRDELDAGTDPSDDGSFPSGCVPQAGRMCLRQGRFALRVDWRDFDGNVGSGSVVPNGSDDSGLFWFFSPDNWEMLVKVLDGCSVNGHFWVFAAATTNVEYTLTVLDTESNVAKPYTNPLGTSAAAITDTAAFATCP